MGRKLTLSMIALLSLLANAATAIDLESVRLRVANYAIDYSIDFENEVLSADCAMKVANPTDEVVTEIPLLLYRLLAVDSVVSSSGERMEFSQEVRTFVDWSAMQRNYIRVYPNHGLAQGDTISFVVFYAGRLLGYAETGMLYTRDKIDTAFTILRPDGGAYPELGVLSWKANRAMGMQEFNYAVSVTVPKPLVAANGGQLVGVREFGDSKEYTFKNIKPAWRIDLAISRYETIETGLDQVYFFPQDRGGATKLAEAMRATLDLYSSWWGELPDYHGFTVIEIPDGWGSQADVTSILQTAAAFSEPDQMYQLYHELSHQWNAASLDSVPPRWEEGLATFIQYLAVEKLENKPALDAATARILTSVQRRLRESEDLVTTPFGDFGRSGQTDFSYTLGMLFFRLIYDELGEEDFHQVIGSFFRDYRSTGATTEEFGHFLKSNSGGKLKTAVANWLSGHLYADEILAASQWSDVAARYK